MMNNVQQILPGFTVRSDASFEDFYTSPSQALVKLSLLEHLDGKSPAFIYLCGVDGVGKSHLLQASCHRQIEQGKTALYLPLKELYDYAPEDIFENTEDMDLVCIDDLEQIIGNQQWEEALFHLYNKRLTTHTALFLAANKTVNDLGVHLADLHTRLSACLSFQLPVLSDAEKSQLIQFRANLTSMELNDACVQFILHRSGRHIADLIDVLERLDKETLAAGRKVTVPFIKKIFQW